MDEKLKEQLMPAIVVFNLTVVVYVLARFFMSDSGMFMGQFFTQALIGAAIGLVTGGITFGIMMMRGR